MTFPKAADFQPETNPIDYDKWHEMVMSNIAQCINANANHLKKGAAIDYQFPTYRDGGAAARLWKQHYRTIADEVIGYGWDVNIIGDGFASPMLVIRVP
jgi:hypothetical protein